MATFNQFSFVGGLDTQLDAAKLPVDRYSLLLNGRISRNTIKPIRDNLRMDAPSGTFQGLYAVGDLLILLSSGILYYRNVVTGTPWQSPMTWISMSTTAPVIDATLVPLSYNQFTYSGTPDNLLPAFNASMVKTPKGLLLTDGINQPRIVFPDASWRVLGTYASWTVNNPEYVPIGSKPVLSGSKLYMVAPNGIDIYHSVTGRPLDFVVNRDVTGNKGGDADSISKTIDFNPITSLVPGQDGGLVVCTLYSTYAVSLDYDNTLFAEPKLVDSFAFPTGAVSSRAWADISGDIAFISQAGIQAFNYTAQVKRESNNYPLGARIASLLVLPQTQATATNFQQYALFAVNTIYGYGILVYDTTLQAFVSLDLGCGQVTFFATVKSNGVERLFFINSSNELYEAYASSSFSTCGVYLGDYNTVDAEYDHHVQHIKAGFTNVREDVVAQMIYFGNRQIIDSCQRRLSSSVIASTAPVQPPYPAFRDYVPVTFRPKDSPAVFKSGVFLEWRGEADLLGLSVNVVDAVEDCKQILIPSTYKKVLTAFGDQELGTELAGGTPVLTPITVTYGAEYVVLGEVHTGFKILTDCVFTASGTTVYVKGYLRAVGNCYNVIKQMLVERPDIVIGLGNHFHPSGTSTDANIFNILLKDTKSRLKWCAGEHDIATLSGKAFFDYLPSLRYYNYRSGDVELFFINSGYPDGGGGTTEPDGNTATSIQGMYLIKKMQDSTAKFKIAVVHHPPYLYPDLQWPFSNYGVQLVLTGFTHNYQRRLIGGIQHVTAGVGGNPGSVDGAGSLVYVPGITGYLLLEVDEYNLRGCFKGINGRIYDTFFVRR